MTMTKFSERLTALEAQVPKPASAQEGAIPEQGYYQILLSFERREADGTLFPDHVPMLASLRRRFRSNRTGGDHA
jgi:hypothetical protein